MNRMVWAALVCFAASIGCRSRTAPDIAPSPALSEQLDHDDPLYDDAASMLRVAFDSPGYHSRIESGAPVHPTRESLVYALALLQRGRPADVQRATAIVRRVLPLQDVDPESETYGVWPWLLEEPLDAMSSPDLNWADFCGATIAQIIVRHSAQLSDDVVDQLKSSLERAAQAIRKRDVGPSYTNIAVMGGGVCVIAGEILNDPALVSYGKRRLQKVVTLTESEGGFREYNSPPYCIVVIRECERTIDLSQDMETRQAAEKIRRLAWQTIAESFHPGTQQWAGPHSRTSKDRLRASAAKFISARVGIDIPVHPSMSGGPPRGHAVVTPLPCPANRKDNFTIGTAGQIRRVFLRDSEDKPRIVGTTWFDQDSCIGSVNQSSFWTQRKPLIAYWKSDEDPAVVFRAKFLHDGREFASAGIQTAQQDNRVLCLVNALQDRGDWHRSLDRPDDGIFEADDLRFRFELRGKGATVRNFGDRNFELTAGEHRVVVHTLPSQWLGKPVRWQSGQDPNSVFVDAVCFDGERTKFDFSHPSPDTIAAGIELLPKGEAASSPPVSEIRDNGRRVTWESIDAELTYPM